MRSSDSPCKRSHHDDSVGTMPHSVEVSRCPEVKWSTLNRDEGGLSKGKSTIWLQFVDSISRAVPACYQHTPCPSVPCPEGLSLEP